AMDDSGGYEISDKDATSFSEMYNASKAKLSAMLDAVSSAEETLAKNLVDSLGSNALLGPAELMLTPALLREGSDFASGGDILGWLHQNIPGARNYSKEEYATRLLSMHRDDFVDRSTGQPMELNPRIYGDSAQDYLQWLYQAMPRDATPGGPSTHLDTIRSTVGGNRYATEGAALEHDSETSWGSGFARSVENFYNTVYGQDAALGHQGTDAMRLQADETLQRENPQLYGKMVHDKLEYIKTYFGHDVVQRYLETHGSGFDGEIDMEDLARYTEHLARQRQGSGNVQAPSGWGGFDSSTTERGRGHSLFLGEKIESWIRQKEGTPNQGATTFQPFQGQLLLYPSDIGGGGKK
ncbi:MAG TPA: hypothetical protein PLP17_14405, partial [Oligoflexia bacterium]|nr:hypothetical protein [Oligoflexia bacterium]